MPGVVFVLVLTPLVGCVAEAALFLAQVDLYYDHRPWTGVTTLLLAVVVAVVCVVPWWCWRWSRRGGVARAWELPVVVSVALVGGLFLAAVPWVWSREQYLVAAGGFVAPWWCGGLALVGALVVWWVPSWRWRPVIAVGSVLAVGVAALGVLWREELGERERGHRELSARVAAVEYPIVVLDAPGWEPVSVEVEDAGSVSISYAPPDPAMARRGFVVRVFTRPVDPRVTEADPGEGRWRPLWEDCSVDGGRLPCEERGERVLVDRSGAHLPRMEVRGMVTEGVAVRLLAEVPTDHADYPLTRTPDVAEMVELVGQVRAVDAEGAQRVVDEVWS